MKNDPAKYKVCILAAGAGTRMGASSDHANRAILPVNHKAVISYIIEKFQVDTEFVIAVGYKKESVIDYVKVAHPKIKAVFVEVKKFAGPGSGPGHSLLACKKHLQVPFIFSAADTIVAEEVPPPSENWIGIAPVHETEAYCTVKVKNNTVFQLDVKMKTDNKFAFIGLAGIHDHAEFFAALERDKKAVANEVQVTNGLNALIERRLAPVGFTWFDTGSAENYAETNKNFSGEDKFDFSKGDEFLYFVGDRVIKFFADKSITEKRHKRAEGPLKGLSPKIEVRKGHFYAYLKKEGQTLYSILDAAVVEEFLAWARKKLWKKLELSPKQKKSFDEACMKFYRDKTMKRMDMFAEKVGSMKELAVINGVRVPLAKELLDKVDWEYIAGGIPSNFHGDLQFDNILAHAHPRTGDRTFTLLDWRHDFGGLTDMGDLYYDLAKLYGGMILSYPLIKDGMFAFDTDGTHAFYHFFVKSDLTEARERYEEFLAEQGYDLKKIRILTSIIFLNMAPLHHGPFDMMLYHLGRSMLHKSLKMR